MIPHPGRAIRNAAVALLPAIISLAFVLPGALAQDEQPADESAAEAAACPVGVYVTSLRDLDPLGDTFGIDFWVWSVHPPGDNPLKSMEFVNAKQIETRLERTTQRGDREWSRLKARATVLHDWDVTDFPFDRQTLTMDLGLAGSDVQACGVGCGCYLIEGMFTLAATADRLGGSVSCSCPTDDPNWGTPSIVFESAPLNTVREWVAEGMREDQEPPP